jgi:NitT/TauT family transport system substrate-binding protein
MGRTAQWTRPFLYLAVLLALALVAAACNGEEPEAAPEEPPAEAPEPPEEPEPAEEEPAEPTEPVTLRVGQLPIVDAAPIHIAIQEGFFEDEGLIVEPENIPGGAAAVPALVAGDLEISSGNHVSFILAHSEGLDIRLIADATYGVSLTNAMLVAEGSEIQSPDDIDGHVIAVNTLENISELVVRSALEAQGVGPDRYELTVVGFPDQPQALADGEIDIAFVPEPFVTILQGQGARVIVDPMISDELDGLPLVGYAATGEFVDNNPEVVAGFVRALQRATELAEQDPDVVAQVLPTYTAIPPEAAGVITYPAWGHEPQREGMERTVVLMEQYGLLAQDVDIDQMLQR